MTGENPRFALLVLLFAQHAQLAQPMVLAHFVAQNPERKSLTRARGGLQGVGRGPAFDKRETEREVPN